MPFIIKYEDILIALKDITEQNPFQITATSNSTYNTYGSCLMLYLDNIETHSSSKIFTFLAKELNNLKP